MPFVKYARANVVYPHVSPVAWGNIRQASTGMPKVARSGQPSDNLIDRASGIIGGQFNPNDYLLTHATIVASVDVYSPAGIKTGSISENGFKINRRYSDFRVKSDCDKFINNNLDGWSRGVLAKSYHTFTGGHNFLEHVQVEDLSKGRIIDAVARDIGDSLYVDILIATSRKHRDLVAAIQNGKMGTLSMGCTVDGTICTKCGHWAADETEMCPDIKYAKGNIFIDDEGKRHRIAELCGHDSIDPTGGVQFIEASWVETPAFTGAVMRNILEPTPIVASRVSRILSEPPAAWVEGAQRRVAYSSEGHKATAELVKATRLAPAKAAPVDLTTLRRANDGSFVVDKVEKLASNDPFLAGWITADDDEVAPEEAPKDEAPAPKEEAKAPAPKEEAPKDEAPKKEAPKDEAPKDEAPADDAPAKKTPTDDVDPSTNENLNHQASSKVYQAGIDAMVRTANSDPALIDSVASYNAALGIDIPVPVYRAALKVGRHTQYDAASFKAACLVAYGRKPTQSELHRTLRLSMLLSRRWSSGGTPAGK